MDPHERKAKDRTVAMTELESQAQPVRRPLPGSSGFVSATRRWWRAWLGAPQVAQFLETDWQRLEMTALLVDRFFREEDAIRAKQLLSEIRLNEELLGGTPTARLRLRWKAVEAEREQERAEAAGERRRRPDPRLRLVERGKGA